ncbi:MAG TPA: transposase [Phycisphaerae bacterium]|nr:transposase [Phycisphaerae bacterium]
MRHSPEQIIAKVREAEAGLSQGQTIGLVCQKLAISEQTFHRWRNQYAALRPGACGRPQQ